MRKPRATEWRGRARQWGGRRRWRYLTVGLTLLALILTACGGSPAAQTTPASAPTAAAAAPAATATSAPLPSVAPTEAPTLVPATVSVPTTAPVATTAPTAAATEAAPTAASTAAAGAAALPTIQTVQTEDTKTITMPGDFFSPIVAVVHAGDTVTWVNKDSDPHSVVSFPGGGVTFDIDIDGGKSGTFTFTKPGIYRYYCDLHADYDQKMDDVKAKEGTDIYPSPMRGVIVVLDKNGNLPASASAAVEVPAATGFFTPWALVVPAGTQITWTNHDPEQHAVVSAKGYATADISTFVLKGSGGTGATALTTPGVYYYYCPVHAKWDAENAQVVPFKSYNKFPFVMDGLVVVTPKA